MIWKILKYVGSLVALVLGVFAGYYITSLFTVNMDVIRFIGRMVGMIMYLVSFFTLEGIIEAKRLNRS